MQTLEVQVSRFATIPPLNPGLSQESKTEVPSTGRESIASECPISNLSPVLSPDTQESGSIASERLAKIKCYNEKSTLPFSPESDYQSARALREELKSLKQQITTQKQYQARVRTACHALGFGEIYETIDGFNRTVTEVADIDKANHRLEVLCQQLVNDIVYIYENTQQQCGDSANDSLLFSSGRKEKESDKILAIVQTVEEQKEYIDFLENKVKIAGKADIREEFFKTHHSPRLRESLMREEQQPQPFEEGQSIVVRSKYKEIKNQLSKRKMSPMYSPVQRLAIGTAINSDSGIKLDALYSARSGRPQPNERLSLISESLRIIVPPSELHRRQKEKSLRNILIHYKVLHRKFVQAVHCSWMVLLQLSSVFRSNMHECWVNTREFLQDLKRDLLKHSVWYTELKSPKYPRLDMLEAVLGAYQVKSQSLFQAPKNIQRLLSQICQFGRI